MYLYILLSLAVYCVFAGFFGLLINQRNLIIILIALELILLGLSSFFIFFSFYLPNLVGQLFALILLTLGGAESALGLALVMVLYRLSFSINLKKLANLKN
jgi:NADH-quinone oxidoreductase subunit K